MSERSVKWCRFRRVGERPSFGLLEGDRVVVVNGSPFDGSHVVTMTSHPLAEVKLLAPVVPPMLYVAGPNFRGHIEAMAKRRGQTAVYPKRPDPNFRSVHAIIGPDEDIVVPKDSCGRLQPEGQLAVVIGRKGRNIPLADALDHVLGCTIGNDITEREWQKVDRTMFRGKNTDTFKPLGPCIATNLDPQNLRVVVRHNGTVWQDYSTSAMIWDVATWLHEMSRNTTLHPGDVLFMGTEGADGDMVAGDVIETEIEGIGLLRNRLVAER